MDRNYSMILEFDNDILKNNPNINNITIPMDLLHMEGVMLNRCITDYGIIQGTRIELQKLD